MTPTRQRISNRQFGELIGCSFVMASRLRNGLRLPSVFFLSKIHDVFSIPYEELIQAHIRGGDAFGKLLRKYIFEPGEGDV